ncbi:MAG: DUF721 domain-containing protein [Rhodobacter sp.]|nr:DUF721 domain-containing protein [Rhodobacter sp.]
MTGQHNKTPRRMRGFERASGLLQSRICKAGETRGFAVARLLTHWAEIVGEDTARAARPVKVSYGQGGFGATLTVLTTGAQAPMLQADLPRIKERVNACYGYAAIARIRITQTAPTGFAEGQAAFKPADAPLPQADRATREAAQRVAAPVRDDGLRHALEELAENVLSRPKHN